MADQPAMFEKRCNRCGELKSFDEFHRHPTGLFGRQPTCKSCISADKERQRRNSALESAKRKADPDKYRDRHLRSLYGITLEDERRLREEQDHRCAICGEEAELHVDHDHAAGHVRGMLCGRCNRGIGMFLDNPARLRAAAAYLERGDSVCCTIEDIFGPDEAARLEALIGAER